MADLSYSYPVIQLDPRTGRPAPGYTISRDFGIYLNDALIKPVQTTVQRAIVVPLTNQSASIGVTSFGLGALSAGMYRISYYAHITQAATTNSSLAVTFGWTDGIALSHTFPSITGNSPGTTDAQTWPVHLTAGPITYATTYGSTGATPMIYALYLQVETVPA